MSTKERKRPLTPEEIRRKAKKILRDNPIYIKDEPPVVGSPDSLTENIEKEDEHTDNKE